MWKNNKKQKISDLPFSKKTVTYARLEAYVFSAVLVFMVWCEKDVSAIAELITVSWATYRGLCAMYLWMCKHEHLMDKKIEYKKLGLDTDNIDIELDEIESEDIEIEDCE